MASGSVPEEEVSFEGWEEHPLSDRLLRYEYCERKKKIPSRTVHLFCCVNQS
jgi:hypothetical protein